MNLLEINAEKLYTILHTSPDEGLSEQQIELNRREFAPETKKNKIGFLKAFRNFFGDIMLLLFFLLSFFAIDVREQRGAGICVMLVFVSYFSLKIFSSLYVGRVEKMIHPHRRSACRVIRDGIEVVVDYSELVPGDVLLIASGDVVPCDALVIRQKTLRVLEVQLTGNTSPVIKLTQNDVISNSGCPYYQCILFAGSVVNSGEAVALVCNVGDSIFDKKNKLVQRVRVDNRPKIYEKAVFVSGRISLVWMIVCAITVIVGILRGGEAFPIFYLASSLSVAILPDIIHTLSEITLATATSRLLKNGAAVKNLSSIDRMCDINCIAVDSSKYFRAAFPKPHTVIVGGEKKRFKNASDDDVRELFEYACIACVSPLDSGEGLYYNGISVEKALVDTAQRLGTPQSQMYEKYLLLEKLPFSQQNGMSRVIVFNESRFYLVSLGTPQSILKICTTTRQNGEERKFHDFEKRSLFSDSNLVAADNEGMVAVAIKEIQYHEGMGQIDNPRGSTFIGFIGLHTAILSDAARAVNRCEKSGIDIILMTNESQETSLGFADSLAIMKKEDRAIDTLEFDKIDEGIFRADIKKYKVFLSFNGEKKGKVIQYRKSDGDIVASTASDVEDIPLQLESDVSFCMDSVRDDTLVRNSDVVLLRGIDTVLECIKYARCVYRNIRHLLEFFMYSQFSLASASFMFLVFLPQIGFTPIQIMLYSVFVFLPLCFVISNERVRGTELNLDFGEENVNINFQNLITLPLICGLTSGLVSALLSRIVLLSGGTNQECRGVGLLALSLTAVFMSFSVVSDSTASLRMFKNKILLAVAPMVTLIAFLMTSLPSASQPLNMMPSKGGDLLLTVLVGIVPCLLSFCISLVKKYVLTKNKEI